MLSRSLARPKKAVRRVAPRVVALESRQLMAVDLMSAGAGSVAVPVAIGRPITASSLAPATFGPWAIGPNGAGAAVNGPYTPSQMRHAYGTDQLNYDGTGQTIAIIDAFDDPTAASDLAAFNKNFNLPTSNFVKVNQAGSTATASMPAYDSGWAFEISLDVQWAHAIAPGATILLVEANSASYADLLTAVDYAVTQTQYPHTSQVSMSWGGGETPDNASIDPHFNHPGITFFASAGDSGTQVESPAVSPYVVGVGGTTISLDAAGNKISETSWSGSGGAVSSYTSRPSFQDGFETATGRGVPDVSYDANPSSGVPVYDNGSLMGVGGTSAGAPQWAGLMALANQGRAAAGLAPVGTGKAFGTNTVLYSLAGSGSYTNPNGDFLDITSGSNGLPAGPGYDNVTGLGSPVANKLIPDLVGTVATPPTSSARYVSTDTTTQGNWSPTYGTTGYDVIGGSASIPAYATVTPTGNQSYTWAGSTADARAPLTAPGSTTRVASTWYGSTFNVDLNLTDGQAHPVSAYLLDWDGYGRSEQVDVLDAATGTVLDSRTASGFSGGQYLTWTLAGHVTLRFTALSGPNAVLSGLFFGGTPAQPTSSASFVGADTTTKGTWSPTYGSDGYNVIGGTASVPAYAAITPAGQASYTWAGSTADARAPLTAPGATTRVASTWYGSTFTVDVNLTDGKTHTVSAYLLDWDGQGRSERVDVLDAATGTTLDTRTTSGFSGGQYLTWNLAGHVTLRFTNLAGPNAVLSGLFFGAAPSKPTSSAGFVGTDTTTQGTWSPTYGTAGYDVIGGSASLPTYATVTPSGNQSYTWAGSTADARAPLTAPGSTTRVASTWYGSTFNVDVNLSDTQAHKVSAYLLDWDSYGRSERIDVVDAATGVTLDTRTASGFSGGQYLTWNLTGHVVLRFTALSGPNAVLSGLFFA